MNLFDDLLRCLACGHLTLDICMGPDEIRSLYTNYYPRSDFDVEAWSPPTEVSPLRVWWSGLRSSAFRWVPRDVRVLDIGCGVGESLGYHRVRGCEAHGVEADANILRVATRHGLNVRVGLFDANAYTPSSFDFVTLDQVIEHVSDPVPMLTGVAKVLKPGGIAIISTPNAFGWGARVFGRRWIHWHAPYHQQFFTTASLRRAADAAGFTMEHTRTVTSAAWLGFQWCHLAAPSVQGPSVFWDAKLPRRFTQRVLFSLSAVADRLGVNSVITRLFDAFGLGDNRVFVLRKARA
jgi:2-polyprenyl-3-methyl-5-hydroxy-6-metoxy-1,4-benzoquinol methylase